VETARIGGATYCTMSRLRIIHVRLGAMSGLKSNIAPCMKVPAAEMVQPPHETTGKVPSWNSKTEMQPPIENSGAQLFNKLEVSALLSIRSSDSKAANGRRIAAREAPVCWPR
jgi:hypothetical protein